MIKIVSFFEEHIEKVVLAIVGLVCLWLLVAPPIDPLPRVLFSPNAVSCDNRKFSPGSIDDYIGAKAELLRQKLDQPSTAALPEPNKPALTLRDFNAMLGSAVSDVDTGVYLPQPYSSSRQRIAGGKYHLPEIGEVNDVAVEHIRAVAYVPVEEITEQNTYDKASNEPNDIDLVTVEAKFDVEGLNKRFHECFASEDVPAEWRDPCLAKPVFAAVQLQRQELNPDGSWSDWQTVPRIKIDHLRRLFEVIEDTDKLPPGGIKVRLVQFDNREVMMDLLQPPVYQIASADQEWFPPSLHKKFVEVQKQQGMEEKRKALEEKKSARDEKLQEQRTGTQEGQSRTGRAQTERLSARSPGGDSGVTDVSGSRTRPRRIPAERRVEGGGLQSDSRRSRDSGTSTDTGRLPRRGEQGDERETDKERLAKARELSAQQAMSDIYNGLNSILITLRTDLSKMREPLVFWAHDDTAEPKKTYRYRIRLGVFNPIAGTPELSAKAETVAQQDKSRVKNAILWSEFSSPTQTVEIPGVLYFFAKGIQEAARKVTVQVSKYMMGYWHSEDFLVGQGEVIGKVAESKPPAPAPAPVPTARDAGASRGRASTELSRTSRIEAGPSAFLRRQDGGRLTSDTAQDVALSMPETVDYSTGAVLVDVVLVNDWSGGSGRNMLARHYFDMLYSFDGTNIEHAPVDMKYWSAELRTVYGEIQNLQKEPREPLRTWGTQGAGFGGIAPTPLYRREGYDARMTEEGG
jgi:hypothetical protein